MTTPIQSRLFSLRDEKYAEFQSKLIPNIPKESIIGVRTPQLKTLAKELAGTEAAKDFINSLPHKYFEENQLHVFIIALEKDFNICLDSVNRFLPYVNNWATCDQLSPKCFHKQSTALANEIYGWLNSSHTYTKRFGIVACMRYYLGDDFSPDFAKTIANIQSDEYYINMAIAWYFATALAKNWAEILPYITEKKLSPWVHNKTIQKATESYRITQEQKSFLKGEKY